MKFMCFGGGAAVVADDYDEAAVAAAEAARHRGQRRSLASSFRRKFLSGGKEDKKKKKSSPAEKGRASEDWAGSIYDKSTTASSSVPSSGPLSLSSTASSLSSSSCASSVSTASSSVLRALPSPHRQTPGPNKWRQASPATGATAIMLCLLMVVLCGKVGATLLTSAVLYLLPRLWFAPAARKGGAPRRRVHRERG